jgi:hypothetical protein
VFAHAGVILPFLTGFIRIMHIGSRLFIRVDLQDQCVGIGEWSVILKERMHDVRLHLYSTDPRFLSAPSGRNSLVFIYG